MMQPRDVRRLRRWLKRGEQRAKVVHDGIKAWKARAPQGTYPPFSEVAKREIHEHFGFTYLDDLMQNGAEPGREYVDQG